MECKQKGWHVQLLPGGSGLPNTGSWLWYIKGGDQQWLATSVEPPTQVCLLSDAAGWSKWEATLQKSPHLTCINTVLGLFKTFEEYSPKQQLFLHLLRWPKSKILSQTLSFCIAVTLVLSLTCGDLLMQLLRKLEKKSRVVETPAVCCFVPGLPH